MDKKCLITYFSFTGNTFSYDPTLGNLLLDIKITDFSHSGFTKVALYDARNVNAGGIFSRAHNFNAPNSGVFDGYGLITKFDPIPEPSSILLLGFGVIGISGFRRKIKK